MVHAKGIFRAPMVAALLAAVATVGARQTHSAVYGTTESTIDPSVVAIDESKYLGAPVARDYVLVDAKGEEFTLGSMMDRPLILLFSYYTCDGVCPTVNKYLATLLRKIDRFALGKDYHVLTVSFDKHDKVEGLRRFIEKVGVPGELQAGWKQAVLKDEADIERLTGSVGVRYFWSYRDRVFVHPNAFIFVSPEGRVTRYLYGTTIDEDDMELALIDANWNKIAKAGKFIDILAGVCYSYNFKEGRYTVNYPLFIGMGSLLLGIVLVAVSFTVVKRRKFRGLGHV